MMIGWTTAGTREDAERLAQGLVDAKLAACTQVSGPITSFYRWENQLHTDQEFRVAVKFPASRQRDVSAWISKHHAYQTPQWLAVQVEAAAEKYLKWVVDEPT